MSKILIVDDDAAQRTIIASILRSEKYAVCEADGVESALRQIRDEAPDVVLTDLKMQGCSGLDIVEKTAALAEAPEVVVMTAYGSVATAVRAMRLGAYDYLNKPLERDELVITVERAAEKRALRLSGIRVRDDQVRRLFDGFVVESAAMRRIMETVKKVAVSDATVLITGESGTGKERIAGLIHYLGPRGIRPMQSVNCAAVAESLLESELFGHEKGAFTGATGRKPGIVETADGGTLFLDEIGEMSPAMQTKVLRLVQDKEIRRVGGTQSFCVDVRIIAATNRDLAAAVVRGAFREDLFYRLNVIPIALPPLRERREEIPALIETFLQRSGNNHSIAPDALKALCAYPWRGNVRELQTLIQRLCILSDSAIVELGDLPLEIRDARRAPQDQSPLLPSIILPEQGLIFEDLERALIKQALDRSSGVLTDAAKLLGMTYRTLQYRAAKFGFIQNA